MLATSGSALAAIQVLLGKSVAEENIILLNVLTVPEGLSVVCQRHPKVKIVTTAIDERLNEDAYMMPGIGDFGDRFFGTDQ
jgi:uracil phosphoribosyltransferase